MNNDIVSGGETQAAHRCFLFEIERMGRETNKRTQDNRSAKASDYLREAVENLYNVFAHYRLGSDFADSVSLRDFELLAKTPLSKLRFEDLQRYVFKAITTWGEVNHFKHFLPRMLDILDDFLGEFELEVLFGKLRYGKFETWPTPEQTAVNRFLDLYWKKSLADPELEIDDLICAIAIPLQSIQPFLKIWQETKTEVAAIHFAKFLNANDRELLRMGRLCNAFWDANGLPAKEMMDWLQLDDHHPYLNLIDESIIEREFPYLRSQLTAVQAALKRSIN